MKPYPARWAKSGSNAKHCNVEHRTPLPGQRTQRPGTGGTPRPGPRVAPIGDSKEVRALLEKGMIVVHEDHFLVKGCYTGDFGGVYLHYGLSLMECLTPWLVVRRVRR